MAELKYDDKGRLIFTKEMKDEGYTLLMPQMLPIHFAFLQTVLQEKGYKVEVLDSYGSHIVESGLKNVHNDTCYPALLTIGQLIDAVKSGNYDTNKVALLMTQTGGGCRASNYIHLLRKALIKADLAHVPVISFNPSGLEKNDGFKVFDWTTIKTMIYSVVYGDMLMWLRNYTQAYEINKNDTQLLVEKWTDFINTEIKLKKRINFKKVQAHLKQMAIEFSQIEMDLNKEIIPVGIVGEIYIKFAPLGNNNLEGFLQEEKARVVVPGLMDFLIYTIDAKLEDINIYHIQRKLKLVYTIIKKQLLKTQWMMINAIKENTSLPYPTDFETLKQLVVGVVGHGNKMGEGWLLTAEMIELIKMGIPNIVCTQPFGCLPNHIVGKGMIKKIRSLYPQSNIVSIDYDPGASIVNQENRIKLMLSTAKENKCNSENNK